MSVLKYLKNIPRSSPIGQQALSVIFFLQIRNEVPGIKKGMSPPRAIGACRPPQGRQGPVARWGGDRVPSPLYKPWPPFAAIPVVI